MIVPEPDRHVHRRGLPDASGGTRCIILAVFAAIITPTPTSITMMYLFVPMFGLYMLGIVFCYFFPGCSCEDEDEAESPRRRSEVAV